MDEALEVMELEEDTQKDKYLIFSIGDEEYGIEIRYVTEIIGIQPITEIPEVPEYIKGVINLRGKIIPVMDVRTRFKKQPREYGDRTCIIIVEFKEFSIGLVIDSVSEVIDIPEGNIALPPKITTNTSGKYISGLGKVQNGVKLLLNCERMFEESEMKEVNDII